MLTGGGFAPDKASILKESRTLGSLIRTVAIVTAPVDERAVSGEEGDQLHPPSGKPGYFSTSHPAWLYLR